MKIEVLKEFLESELKTTMKEIKDLCNSTEYRYDINVRNEEIASRCGKRDFIRELIKKVS